MNPTTHPEALKNLTQKIKTAAGNQDKIDLAVGNYYFDVLSAVGKTLKSCTPSLMIEALAGQGRYEISVSAINRTNGDNVVVGFKRLSVFATHPKAPGTVKVFNGQDPSDFLEMRLKPEIEVEGEPSIKLVNILQPEVIEAIHRAIGVDLGRQPSRGASSPQKQKDLNLHLWGPIC